MAKNYLFFLVMRLQSIIFGDQREKYLIAHELNVFYNYISGVHNDLFSEITVVLFPMEAFFVT